jgi:SAM-dependent methyltransferase
MTSDHREQAAFDFYGPLAKSEDASRRVGWESDHAHRARLRALVQALKPFQGIHSILDAGCGEGRLIHILQEAGYRGAYLGEDILAHMIEKAGKLQPDHHFVVRDSFTEGSPHDAVICSGALNTVVAPDHDEEVISAITALWERTREVLAIDMAVKDRHHPGEGLALTDIEKIWCGVRELTPILTVQEGVIPGEAIVILRRNRRWQLEHLLPDSSDILGLAELLLHGKEAAAAREYLSGRGDPESRILCALADLELGRYRQAEQSLRILVSSRPTMESAGAGTSPGETAVEEVDSGSSPGGPTGESVGSGSSPGGTAGLSRGPVAERALLYLASLLSTTRRVSEAEKLLRILVQSHTPIADEGRFMLAQMLLSRGESADASSLLGEIRDPWVKREASRMSK